MEQDVPTRAIGEESTFSDFDAAAVGNLNQDRLKLLSRVVTPRDRPNSARTHSIH